MQAKKKERKDLRKKKESQRFEECHTRDILIKLFNTHVTLPQILLETIITCKNNHMQENEKSKQKKEKNTLNNVIINMRYV